MNNNSQKFIDGLQELVPVFLDKYVVRDKPFNFQSFLEDSTIDCKRIFEMFSQHCETVSDIYDIYLWTGSLPNWWNTVPFTQCKQNFYLFLHYFAEERKHKSFLYKFIMDLKRTHLAEKKMIIS